MRRETTLKRKTKFKEWFEGLEPGEQLRTLACLMRLKEVRASGKNYDETIRRCIFRIEKKKGNSELLKFFTGIGIEEDQFKGLVYYFFDTGRTIRGHRKKEKPKKMVAGCCGALVGAAGFSLLNKKSYGILEKKHKRTVH